LCEKYISPIKSFEQLAAQRLGLAAGRLYQDDTFSGVSRKASHFILGAQ
jgi:hypothetical protein